MTAETYSGRLGIQQRVFPFYRAAFIDTLAARCLNGACLFAGQPRPDEAIDSSGQLTTARFTPTHNQHLFSGSLYMCRQPQFVDWLSEWQPNVLIAEANPRYLSTPAAARWMHDRQRPVIGWGLGAPPIHGPLADPRINQRIGFLKNFDAVIAYSQNGAQEYQAAGIPADRVFVAPNAVTPAPQSAPPQRKLFDRLSILFVGRLQSRKRIDLLLRVCASLPLELRPALTIVGDGPERPTLQALAAEIYPEAVFPGHKTGADLDPYFREANLFILPGTGGLAMQQAMSTALAVVVAEGDGTQSNLVTPANGWQIIPGDPADLERVLRLAASDLPALERMGRESFRIVHDEINIDRMADVFIQAVHRVTSR